jgi:sulfoxide reductase catalytic subunit YedY
MNIKPSELTPEHLYLSRRSFLKSAGILAGSAALLAACGVPDSVTLPAPTEGGGATPAMPTPTDVGTTPTAMASADELGDPLTEFDAVTNFNNYYEFTVDKERVASLAEGFPTSPWQVEVGGLVNNPGTYDVDDLRGRFNQEERIYRMRCVEGWSMVIPWIGFPLKALLEEVQPTSDAQYVRFETVLDRENMPGLNSPWYQWPYVEGLRVDEAMNDLTLMATGLYGKTLLPQNGAPLRLVVPWKYGFKSIKSIIKIELVSEMPGSLWMAAAPNEYGFFANVNPDVNHPRWSQSSERRIGELGRRPTLMFNGYEAQVADLYAGMDLKVNY